MLKQRSFVRCVSATLCVGLLSAAVVLGGKVKDPPVPPPPPPPPPAVGVTYKLVDLGIGNVDAIGISAGGVIIGNRSFVFPHVPFRIVPEVIDGKLNWFRDRGDGSNALLDLLEMPDGAEMATVMCLDEGGVAWGVAYASNPQIDLLTPRWLVYWDADGVHSIDDIGGAWPEGYVGMWPDATADGRVLVSLSVPSLTWPDREWDVVLDVDFASGAADATRVATSGNFSATAMNALAEAVGTFSTLELTSPVLLRGLGTDQEELFLLTMPGSTKSDVVDINVHGLAVGWAQYRVPARNQGDYASAYLWHVDDAGVVTATALGTLASVTSANAKYQASSINDNGQVVGACEYPIKGSLNPGSKAFLWQDGQLVDLATTLTNTPKGLDATWAAAINNAGVILGDYRLSGGTRRDCVLIPVVP